MFVAGKVSLPESQPAIAEVGDANEEDLQPSSPEPKKRKMFQCPSCKPSRSFLDERKPIEHMDVCHFFD